MNKEEKTLKTFIKLSKDGLAELDIEKGLFVEWSVHCALHNVQ